MHLTLATTLLALLAAASGDEPKPQAIPEERAESIWEYLVLKYDRDGDGRVSSAEYTRDEEHWKRLDKNSDGFLDEKEIAGSGRASRRAARGSDEAPPEPPKVGQQAPNFDLLVLPEESEKQPAKKKPAKPEFIQLASFKGKRPVALIFGSHT